MKSCLKSAEITLQDGRTLDYRIRLSKRAKYMRMTFSADKGLVITQPANVSNREINAWVKSKQDWISQHLDHIEADQLKSGATLPLTRPEQIEIPILQQTLHIDYQPDRRRGMTVEKADNNTLLVKGPIDDTEHCVLVLQKWLQMYARGPLGDLLEDAAQETGFKYKSYRVKAQRTRWGSCSSLGNINLNYKLLLMPLPWVRYTLIHELCHTIEMNHSRRFWALVGQFVPDYKVIHAEMKDAAAVLPHWVNYQIHPQEHT